MFYSKLVLLWFAILVAYVNASCKGGEGDPYGPHSSPTQRIYSYAPKDKSRDLSVKTGNVLHFLSYNIQSGLSLHCQYNLEAQAELARDAHFFGLQEVDLNNDKRCSCPQAGVVADVTGHTVQFLSCIAYRTGFYGSALSSAFAVLETRYLMYARFSSEQRGAMAIRTTPPHLGGRTLWTLNTHLQFDSEWVRLGQTAELIEFTKKIASEYPEALIVVMGDYYVVPGQESYTQMANYFQNAWAVFTGSPAGGYTYPSDWPNNRFDHIWFKFPAGTKYSLRVEVPDIRLSDHRPLHAYFDFGTGTGTGASSTTGKSATTSTPATTAPVTTAGTSGSTGGCTATATALKTTGPWQVSGGYNSEYSVTVKNSGKCPISSIVLNFGSATIENFWQMTKGANGYSVTLYGDLEAGATVSPGIIVKHTGATSPSVTPTVTVRCPSSCSGGSATTGGSSNTGVPTPKPTPKPTSKPSTTTGSSGTCTANNVGALRCVSSGTAPQFEICDNGAWRAGQQCASPLVCKSSGATAYCDYA